MRLVIERAGNLQFCVRLRGQNGRIVMVSERYKRKASAIKTAKRIRTMMAMHWREIVDKTIA